MKSRYHFCDIRFEYESICSFWKCLSLLTFLNCSGATSFLPSLCLRKMHIVALCILVFKNFICHHSFNLYIPYKERYFQYVFLNKALTYNSSSSAKNVIGFGQQQKYNMTLCILMQKSNCDHYSSRIVVSKIRSKMAA